MPHEVILGRKATNDRDQLWLHVAEHNLGAADRLLDRFEDVFRLLSENPLAGPSRPDLGNGIRTFTVEGHVICYRVVGNAIVVASIFHGARNITRRLLEE